MNIFSRQKIINASKIVAAAVVSVMLAIALKLEFPVSAGIVAILSVQPTKKETIKTGLSRFYAFLAALAISFACYRLLGFTVAAFFLYLFFFIFLCHICEWHSAMAMDSVLISHFLSFGRMGFFELKNEVILFVIGVGTGVLMNIFLRKKVAYIEKLKENADEQIKNVLEMMSRRILNPDVPYCDVECFRKLDSAIFEALSAAEENFNNQFTSRDVFDREYIAMRKNQKEVLLEIYRSLMEIRTVPGTAALVSGFFKKVSVEYEKRNDVKKLIAELHEIQSVMKKKPLPQTRPEFEDRAMLFVMLRRMEDFLNLKSEFYARHFN